MIVSAALNSRSENIVVEAVVIFELTFRDVQRQIFTADLMITADDAALEDAPEAFNRVRVDRADDVLVRLVVDATERIVGQIIVDAAFVGREQTHLVRHNAINETFGFKACDATENAGDNVALPLDRADDRGLSASAALNAAASAVFVLGFAAYPSFVDLNDAAQLVHVSLDQRDADFVTHAPSCPVRAKTHVAHDLKGAHPLLAGQHQVSDLEPLAQRLVRVFKNGARDMREAITRTLGRLTGVALPFEGHRLHRKYLGIAATGAADPIRPAARDQISGASFLVGEGFLELAFGHLVDWLRTTFGHDGSPSRQEPIWQLILYQSSPA